MNIYHVINPFKSDKESQQFKEQERTLETLFNAVSFTPEMIKVQLVLKVDPDDYSYYKSRFNDKEHIVVELKESSTTIGKNFKVPRNLPILSDMLDLTELSLNENKSESLVVVTNMDICVQPFFYAEIARIYSSGIDTFVVNRRTVPKELIDTELEESYFSDGEQHIGHDCFVFPYQKLKLYDIREHILGIGFVFRPFLLNCILHSDTFMEFDDSYITFHYGDDMDWKNPKFDDYLEHNKQLLIDVYKSNLPIVESLSKTKDVEKLAWIEKFFSFGFLKD